MGQLLSLVTNRRIIVIAGVTLAYLMLMFWVTFDYWAYLYHLLPLSFNQQTVWFEPQDYDRLILRSFLLSLLYVFSVCLTFSSERTVVGAWLTALYVVCVSLVVFSLSTHLFQDKINSLEVDDEADKLAYIQHECKADSIRWVTTDDVVPVDCIPRNDVSAKSKEYYLPAEVANDYSIWKNQRLHIEALANYTVRKEKIQQRLKLVTGDKAGKKEDLENELGVVQEAIKSLKEKVKLPGTSQEGKDPNSMSIEELKQEIKKLKEPSLAENFQGTPSDDLSGAGNSTQGNSIGAQPKNTTQKTEEEQLSKEQLRKELEDLRFDKGDLDNENKSLVRNKYRTPSTILFAEIESFEDFFWIFSQIFGIQYYWKVPKPILNINLILFMGVLGSLIFVSIEFIKIPRERISGHSEINYTMYFVRPFLGMIIALAMYVMVNSGLSAFPGSAAGELSPFLLSFLGIISGMLAEQAYQRLADTGTKAMGGTNDKSDKTNAKGQKDTNKETLEYSYSTGVPTTAYYHWDTTSIEAADKPVKRSTGDTQTTERGDGK